MLTKTSTGSQLFVPPREAKEWQHICWGGPEGAYSLHCTSLTVRETDKEQLKRKPSLIVEAPPICCRYWPEGSISRIRIIIIVVII